MEPIAAQDPPRPSAPPEWTPPPGTPSKPPVTPPTPERPPALPMIVTPLDERTYDDVTMQLLERRIILLTGRLDCAAADDAAARLLLLDERGHDPITVHLSCPEADL